MTEIQKAYLSIIKNTNFNSFNGNEIVNDLLMNKKLWEYVKPTFTLNSPEFDIKEIESKEPFIDTLLIKVTNRYKGKWKHLFHKWKADSITNINENVIEIYFD